MKYKIITFTFSQISNNDKNSTVNDMAQNHVVLDKSTLFWSTLKIKWCHFIVISYWIFVVLLFLQYFDNCEKLKIMIQTSLFKKYKIDEKANEKLWFDWQSFVNYILKESSMNLLSIFSVPCKSSQRQSRVVKQTACWCVFSHIGTRYSQSLLVVQNFADVLAVFIKKKLNRDT